MGFNPVLFTLSTQILNGQTTSGVIDTGGASLVSIQTPSVLTGTTFTFEASLNGIDFLPLYKTEDISVFTANTGADRVTTLPGSPFSVIRFLKIVSSATELGDRDLLLGLRPL